MADVYYVDAVGTHLIKRTQMLSMYKLSEADAKRKQQVLKEIQSIQKRYGAEIRKMRELELIKFGGGGLSPRKEIKLEMDEAELRKIIDKLSALHRVYNSIPHYGKPDAYKEVKGTKHKVGDILPL